ncbi:MAG: sugar nucleotide-binding protein [Anaerolineae bacterium]|nr:sugar nucleotide-binding protein [Anaerolineae bacterium]
MSKVDLLVIGGSGFVGAHLVKMAATAGYRVAYTYANHRTVLPAQAHQVKIEEERVLEACITDTQPRIIVYCAVLPSKGDHTIHRIVNVEGVYRVLASLDAVAHQTLFVYLSTNAIFSGRQGPYRESDIPDPEARQDAYRAYALTRCEGENAALSNWSNTLVVRTATVNGRDIQGRLNARLAIPVARLLAGQPLPLFCDRYISPTSVDNLVEALLEIIGPDFTYRGILHLAGSQRVTDYEYGCYLAQHLGIEEHLVRKDYMADSPLLSNGPRDGSLDTAFTQSLLETRLLKVAEQLALTFQLK